MLLLLMVMVVCGQWFDVDDNAGIGMSNTSIQFDFELDMERRCFTQQKKTEKDIETNIELNFQKKHTI